MVARSRVGNGSPDGMTTALRRALRRERARGRRHEMSAEISLENARAAAASAWIDPDLGTPGSPSPRSTCCARSRAGCRASPAHRRSAPRNLLDFDATIVGARHFTVGRTPASRGGVRLPADYAAGCASRRPRPGLYPETADGRLHARARRLDRWCIARILRLARLPALADTRVCTQRHSRCSSPRRAPSGRRLAELTRPRRSQPASPRSPRIARDLELSTFERDAILVALARSSRSSTRRATANSQRAARRHATVDLVCDCAVAPRRSRAVTARPGTRRAARDEPRVPDIAGAARPSSGPPPPRPRLPAPRIRHALAPASNPPPTYASRCLPEESRHALAASPRRSHRPAIAGHRLVADAGQAPRQEHARSSAVAARPRPGLRRTGKRALGRAVAPLVARLRATRPRRSRGMAGRTRRLCARCSTRSPARASQSRVAATKPTGAPSSRARSMPPASTSTTSPSPPAVEPRSRRAAADTPRLGRASTSAGPRQSTADRTRA